MNRRVKQLEEYERRWRTSMGKFCAGEHVILRGKDLHNDFRNTDWMKFFMFAITGREFSDNQVSLMSSLWIYTSYPDPRIWNNRVASLTASARSTCSLAIGAATAVSDAHIYGRQADLRAISFLFRAKSHIDGGSSLKDFVFSELKTKRNIGGFGRPMFKGDERIPYALNRARELQLDNGAYISILRRVQGIFKKEGYPIEMNFGGLTSALCADMGFTSLEYYAIATLVFSAGMFACYLDALDHNEGAFFPLRCSSIIYKGTPIRRWSD